MSDLVVFPPSRSPGLVKSIADVLEAIADDARSAAEWREIVEPWGQRLRDAGLSLDAVDHEVEQLHQAAALELRNARGGARPTRHG